MQTIEPMEAPRSGLATVEQAAKFLNLCRTTIYAMLRDNQLAAVKIRNATRIPWGALHSIADAAHLEVEQ
jgi:excisionase family DNA binding protein